LSTNSIDRTHLKLCTYCDIGERTLAAISAEALLKRQSLFYAIIQWWMQAASKSSQGGNSRGNLEDHCIMTLHHTIMT